MLSPATQPGTITGLSDGSQSVKGSSRLKSGNSGEGSPSKKKGNVASRTRAQTKFENVCVCLGTYVYVQCANIDVCLVLQITKKSDKKTG